MKTTLTTLLLITLISSCNRETKTEKMYREYIVKVNAYYDTQSMQYDSLYKESMEICRIAIAQTKYVDSLRKELKKCK